MPNTLPFHPPLPPPGLGGKIPPNWPGGSGIAYPMDSGGGDTCSPPSGPGGGGACGNSSYYASPVPSPGPGQNAGVQVNGRIGIHIPECNE